MVLRYALYGYDINTELVGQKIIIPVDKEQSVLRYLKISTDLMGFDVELETYKVQEILDRLSIRVIVNEYDWFLTEIEEN